MILYYPDSECNFEIIQSSGSSLGSLPAGEWNPLLIASSSLFKGRLSRGFS